MNKKEMQSYIEAAIPSTRCLGIQLSRCDTDEVVVEAPLAINRNHVGTAFGGSLNTLLTLSAWTWLFHRLQQEGHTSEVVIQSAQIEYLLPVTEDSLAAECRGTSAEDWNRFYRTYSRRGLGRLRLQAELRVGGSVAVRFKGQFVATRPAEPGD